MAVYTALPLEDLESAGLGKEGEKPGTISRKYERHVGLVSAMVLPFGAHVCYKMTSAVEKYVLESMDIDSTQFGVLNSAVSWNSLALVPLAAGFLVDTRPTRYAAVIFTAVTLVGHLMFSIAATSGDLAWAAAGRAIFGMGESTVTVVQGALCAQWFRSKEQIALAIGLTEMSHNIANWLGKVSIEVGLAWGGWEMTLWFGVLLCALSFAVAVGYFVFERAAEETAVASSDLIATKSRYRLRDLAGARELSALFWLFCLLHFVVSNVEHLFDAVSTDFIKQKWGIKWTSAAWLSSLNYSLPILLSPFVGYLLDVSSHRVPIAAAGCGLMTAGHFILGFLPWSPVAGLLVLSVAESVLPTILRASVPLVVPHGVSGVAFGVYDVAENFGKVVGNPLVGYFKDKTHNYVLDEQIFVAMSGLGILCCLAIAVVDARGSNVLGARAGDYDVAALPDAEKPEAVVTDSDLRLLTDPDDEREDEDQ
mmetsp:Transcript_28699/g.58413  ORF Transcript_28699/g.58413 Transcript_28699/m.58413 type:complete len:480 (-) Transcript_28699:276-1715(-)